MSLPVVTPPFSKLGRKIESATRKALYDFAMVEGKTRLAIALSGGKDSLTMLYMLKAISGRGFPELDLVAINVGGAFSCGAGVDHQHLGALCSDLGVEYVQRESTQKLETLACYPCSRERRKLLFEAAKEHDCDTIAFGHHRDDNAQTLLLNLLHKGEFAGMLPFVEMEDYGVTIIRPLIFVTEDEVREFARLNGFARISCRCPVGQNSMRRQVDKAIDELEVLFPNIRTNLSQASLVYGSDKASRK